MSNKILLAIPTYNCEKQITRVLSEIDVKLYKSVEHIAVIDNGSIDNTPKVALQFKKKHKKDKLHIYINDNNYSLGGTHKVEFLMAKKMKCTHVIILHGDNKAKRSEANNIIDYAESQIRYQTVLGSRFSKGSILIGYDIKRILGNKVLNTIYSIFTLKKCSDLGSGLNLFALQDLEQNTYLQFADKLTFNYEMLLDLIKRKRNFAYIPITWREEDQVTNARNLNIFKTALVNLFQWRFGKKYTTTNSPNDYTCKEIA